MRRLLRGKLSGTVGTTRLVFLQLLRGLPTITRAPPKAHSLADTVSAFYGILVPPLARVLAVKKRPYTVRQRQLLI